MKMLICDLNVYDNGHHVAFVNSILEYSMDKENIIFLFNRKAAHYCRQIENDKRVFFVEEAILQKNKNSVIMGKFREYLFIRQFATQHNIEKLILLEIDQYQIAIGITPVPFKVTGIYFRSFHNIRIFSGSFLRSFKNGLYYMKKRMMFIVLRFNRKVEPLFIMNDHFANLRYPSYFRYLPDPVFINNQDLLSNSTRPDSLQAKHPGLRDLYHIFSTTHIFLAFGAMGARKNIANIISAYSEACMNSKSVLMIAGKVRNDYKTEFYRSVDDFKSNNTDKKKSLIVVDEYIKDDLIDIYFKDSDTIILCYKKFYGSSGLMGKAALHYKPCIVPKEGLLSELSRQYQLGYEADPLSVPDIARAFLLAEKKTIISAQWKKFVNDHSEQAFNDAILA